MGGWVGGWFTEVEKGPAGSGALVQEGVEEEEADEEGGTMHSSFSSFSSSSSSFSFWFWFAEEEGQEDEARELPCAVSEVDGWVGG